MLRVNPDDLGSAQTLARLYIENAKPEEAGRVLRRARHYHPDDVALWELTVKTAGGPTEEEEIYRQVVRRFPDDPKYAVALGSVLGERGQQAEARKVLEPLTREGPPAVRALAHLYLARGYQAEGQTDKALQNLEAADRADAVSTATPEALLFRAELFEKLGKAREAAVAYRRLADTDGNAARGLLALIRIEVKWGDKTPALDDLRRYVLAVGHDQSGLLSAADFYLRLGRTDEAFDLASRASVQRFHEQAHRILGLVYRQRGDYARAVVHLDKADMDADVLEALIRSHLALGQLKEALERADQGDRLDEATAGLRQAVIMANSLAERRREVLKTARVPAGRQEAWNDAAARFVCAEYAWREGHSADVVETLLAPALADGMALGPAYGLRGYLALERGRLSKALADADRAVALSPAEPVGYLVRGRVRLERGSDGALADLTRAVELTAHRDPAALHWFAAAQFRAGRLAEALAAQRQAVKLRPRDRELTEQLQEYEGAGKNGAGG